MTPSGDWIIGTTLNHSKFAVLTLPTRADLNAVPNPVLITHQCGHSFFVISLAIASFDECQFSNLERVGRNNTRRMMGVLQNGAEAPLLYHLEKLDDDCTVNCLRAIHSVVNLGIAEIGAIAAAIVLTQAPVHVCKSLRDAGQLSVCIRLCLTERPDGHHIDDNEWLSYGGHKIFVDEVFGERMPVMQELFNDTNRRGILRSMDGEFSECLKESFDCGLQIIMHVIGERGLDKLLGALERLASEGVRSDWPMKLMYCELCYPEQVDRIRASCNVQPEQLTSKMLFLPAAIGEERMQHCFPFCSIIDAGVTIVR
jgi:predicted amidohydrolase YtcJ